jgi:ferredoxin
MQKVQRKIIKINEDKCDGCGLCAQACHEGAIVMENGKARLASDSYCDGLGDCIGECPRGAITFEVREAAPYDEEAVKARMAAREAASPSPCSGGAPKMSGCPGKMARSLKTPKQKGVQVQAAPSAKQESELMNWPVQLALAPVNAPYLNGAHLLIAADCTGFAYPSFHRDLLPGKVCLVGCPKLDEVEPYIEKIAQIIKQNGIGEIDVVYMEVPCCGGLVRLVDEAVKRAGEPIILKLTKISLQGKILEIKQTFPD